MEDLLMVISLSEFKVVSNRRDKPEQSRLNGFCFGGIGFAVAESDDVSIFASIGIVKREIPAGFKPGTLLFDPCGAQIQTVISRHPIGIAI